MASPGAAERAPAAPALYTRDYWTACVVHFTGALSLEMFVLVPLLIREVGGTELTIGLALGFGVAASVAFRPVVGTLLDRIGRRRVLLWCGFVNAVSWLPFLAVTSVGPLLYAAVAFHSIVWGALFAAYFTYAADLVPAERRAEGLAVFGVAGVAAHGISPLLGEEVIEIYGYDAFFLLAAGFATVSTLVTLLVRVRAPASVAADTPSKEKAAAPTAAVGTLQGLRLSLAVPGLPLVLSATLILGLAINTANFFVAPFARELGIARVGAFFLAYAAAVVSIRVFGRRMLDVLGPHRVSVPGFASFALGLAVLVLLPEGGVLVLAGFLCGASHGSLFPVLSALVVTRAPTALRGTVVTFQTAVLDFGAVLGTPLCGVIARLWGYRAMFVFVAAVSLGGLALMAADAARSRA